VNVQARAGAAHGGNDVSLAAELKTRSRHEITFFNLSFFLRHRGLRPFFRRPFFRRDTINQLVAVDTYVGLPYERSDGDQSLASRPNYAFDRRKYAPCQIRQTNTRKSLNIIDLYPWIIPMHPSFPHSLMLRRR
jgi:hypothetical protein